MAKTDILHIRIEPKVKSKAESTLNDLGLSITEAINIFLNQIILNDGIPFEVKKPKKYNEETLNAIEETEKMLKNNTGKKYNNFADILLEVNGDTEDKDN